jgi:hypothetical protein
LKKDRSSREGLSSRGLTGCCRDPVVVNGRKEAIHIRGHADLLPAAP